jgi:citrate lyase beta subunit
MESIMEFMRSAMFVPGHRQRFIDKALAGLPCDVFMLDLEDGVPPQEKADGRILTGESLARPRVGRTLRYVRINALASPGSTRTSRPSCGRASTGWCCRR